MSTKTGRIGTFQIYEQCDIPFSKATTEGKYEINADSYITWKQVPESRTKRGIFVNNQLDAQLFFIYVYFYSLQPCTHHQAN